MPCIHLGLLARRSGDHRAARRELSRAVTLLAGEDEARLRLLGGGLPREALLRICSTVLQRGEAAR
jgi:chemotaxis protein methyltransferase CheR